MGGYYFIRDNEVHYDMAASKDKDFIVIEGALHGATPCTACETTPGQYSNSLDNFFDYVAQWIDARYLSQRESVRVKTSATRRGE